MRKILALSILTILASAAFAAAPAAADILTRRIDGTGAREFWTPERLRSARPMPLPSAAVDLERPRADGGFVATNVGALGLHYSSSRLVPEEARFFFPYSAVGRLFFSIDGDFFVCSGAVVSARVVLTAGHCVYGGGDFFEDFLFIPAYHEGDDPFGVWEANFVGTTGEWADSEIVPNTADFGVLVMNDQDIAVRGQQKVLRKIGQVTGWLGWIRNKLEENMVHQLGYPVNLDRGERMHQAVSSDSIEVETSDGDSTFCYGSDMRGGASGGPMVQNFGIAARGQRGGRNRAVNRVVSVNSFTSTDSSLRVLCGSELINSVQSLLNAACSDSGGNCQRKGKPKAP